MQNCREGGRGALMSLNGWSGGKVQACGKRGGLEGEDSKKKGTEKAGGISPSDAERLRNLQKCNPEKGARQDNAFPARR